MNNLRLSRGDIWLVDLDPVVEREQAKKRPCLIISLNTYNYSAAELAVILPLTSQFHALSWLVPIEPPEGGLKKRSYIITDQLRSVSFERFSGDRLGCVSPKILEQVDMRLQILLNL